MSDKKKLLLTDHNAIVAAQSKAAGVWCDCGTEYIWAGLTSQPNTVYCSECNHHKVKLEIRKGYVSNG